MHTELLSHMVQVEQALAIQRAQARRLHDCDGEAVSDDRPRRRSGGLRAVLALRATRRAARIQVLGAGRA